jgi:hypothetical protein
MSGTDMLTALDAPEAAFDEHEKKFVANIREHGWVVTNVFAEGEMPGFSYTTGLWKALGVPELIVFSLKTEAAHQIFWNIFNEAKAGRQFQNGTRINNILNTLDVVLMTVDKQHYREYLGWSRWFYAGDLFPCAQLIWPDRANLFPWNTEFDARFASDQPDLSEAGWKTLIN